MHAMETSTGVLPHFLAEGRTSSVVQSLKGKTNAKVETLASLKYWKQKNLKRIESPK